MEELLAITRENNIMLRYICGYIMNITSPQYQMAEDLRSLGINMTANGMFGGNR